MAYLTHKHLNENLLMNRMCSIVRRTKLVKPVLVVWYCNTTCVEWLNARQTFFQFLDQRHSIQNGTLPLAI